MASSFWSGRNTVTNDIFRCVHSVVHPCITEYCRWRALCTIWCSQPSARINCSCRQHFCWFFFLARVSWNGLYIITQLYLALCFPIMHGQHFWLIRNLYIILHYTWRWYMDWYMDDIWNNNWIPSRFINTTLNLNSFD